MFTEVLFLIAITYVMYQLFVRFAEKINLLDIPNSRSSHKNPTLRGFGMVILISIGITLITFKSFLFVDYPNLLSSILVIGLLGFVDDIKPINPFIKIVTLILVYMLVYAEGFLISNLGIYLGYEFKLHLLISIIFSTLSIVTFTNAFNLIDGLDGLSASVALIILISFLSIGFNNDDILMLTLCFLFITSLSVFIFYNWHPAKVFLGDSGSLMVGFVISILAVRSLNYIEPISILYIAAVPIIDFLFVTTSRISNGISIFKADKGHSHHILLSYFNGNIKKTVISISIFQSFSCFFGITLISRGDDSFIALISFMILFITVYKLLQHLQLKPEKSN